MSKRKTVKRGIVRKVIKSLIPDIPEKAEIAIEEADDLYREIRIENTLIDENGQKVALKPNADVDVIIEADKKDTIPKE